MALNIVKKICPTCQQEFEVRHRNMKTCKLCSIKKSGTFNDLVEYDKSVLDNLTEGVDYVRCELCGFYSKDLSKHISMKGKKSHNMTSEEYLKMFPNAKILCDVSLQERSAMISGDKNPGFNHGGRLSPWSKNNNFLTEEEIEVSKKKAIQSREDNNSYTTSIEYWLKKCDGDEELAKRKLSERQSTFSLDKCIEKYGVEEGTKIWKERQNKWQDTMNSKPEEERIAINRKKISSSNISKSEQELFDTIKKHYINAVQQNVIVSKTSNDIYLYDITVGNKIIEYNGNYWHCDEKRFTDENSVARYSRTGFPILVKDIRERDARKIQTAKDNGYEVFIVWESEYKNNKQKVVEECLKFLSD